MGLSSETTGSWASSRPRSGWDRWLRGGGGGEVGDLRLAVLLAKAGEEQSLSKRLTYPNKVIDKVALLVKAQGVPLESMITDETRGGSSPA